MNPFEMVIGIVLIVTVGRIIQAKLGGHRRRSERPEFGPGAEEDGENRRLRDEVRVLKDRIAVLERLATDDAGPRALEREI